MKWLLKKRILIPAILILAFFLGPKADYPAYNAELPDLKMGLADLDAFIAQRESSFENLKENNEARIVWADSNHQKTKYAIVYLHGFSASQYEGAPLHTNIAKRYGANLYLSRLADHGLEDDDTFENLSPKAMIDSAKEALAIGKMLGDKVILMSCSTGGTLSAYLAANLQEDVHALMMYSPNIDLFDSKSHLLTKPWGLQLARLLPGGKYHHVGIPEEFHKYWTHTYRKEGLVALRTLLDETMTEETFEKITCPVFVGYYYKNEQEQDQTVSVSAMQHFSNSIKTPKKRNVSIAFPNAKGHVFICGARGNDLTEVQKESFKFAEEVLQLQPISSIVEVN